MKSIQKTTYPSIGQSYWIIFKLMGMSVVVAIPFFILLSIFSGDDQNLMENSLVKSVVTLVSYGLTFGWCIWSSKNRYYKKEGLKLSWKKEMPSGFNVFLLVLITIATGILVDPLITLIPVPEYFKDFFADLIQPDVFSFLTIVIAAPILEELLFRGVILDGFLKNYSPHKAIFWSSFIFGAAHLNPWQMLAGILIGYLIGWVYYKSQSLIPGMIIHFVNNLLSFTLFITLPEVDSLEGLITNPVYYYGLLGVSAVVLLVSLKIMKFKPVEIPQQENVVLES